MWPVAVERGIVQPHPVRRRPWAWSLCILSACLEPNPLQLPEGALTEARTLVWLAPEAPPVVIAVDERLPLQLPDEDSRLQAMLYRSAPEELGIEALLSQHGCLPPTERQLALKDGVWTSGPLPDLPQITSCDPCALWPPLVRPTIRVPLPILGMEVGVALPDGQLLFTAFLETGSEMVRLAPDATSVEPVPPLDGPSPVAFSPYYVDDSGVYGMRDKSLWRIELEERGYRAERLTGRHSLSTYDRLSSLIRIDEVWYLATAHGGLLRTSNTSTSGWDLIHDNTLSPRADETTPRTSLAKGEEGGLVAVGVAWEAGHFELRDDGAPRIKGFYDQRAPNDGWRILPLQEEVASVVSEAGRVHVVAVSGNVYRLRADGELDLSYAPSRARNLRYAVAGIGRIWAAPEGGSLLPLYPDSGVACELIPAAFGGLILARETRLVYVSNTDLTILDVPPIQDCGLPAQP